ncbi:hypothetical protein ACWC5I_48345 [Kitasatospora sp. NPDC001574]
MEPVLHGPLRANEPPTRCCFIVSGTTGYLAMELPDVYTTWNHDQFVTARLVTACQVEQADVGPYSTDPGGDGIPGGTRSVHVEQCVTG